MALPTTGRSQPYPNQKQMLLPADLLSSTLMPWAMVAPAIPLLLMLWGRISFTGLNVSILLICIVTMLSNMFYGILPKTPPSIRNDIHLAGIIIESSLSLVLIWNIVSNGIIRKVIIALITILVGGLTLVMSIRSSIPDLKGILSISYLGIALLAGAALYELSQSERESLLTDTPTFWTGAAIAFHYGLMSLLLMVLPAEHMKDWASYPGFGLLFVLSNCIRHAAYAVAVHKGRHLTI